MDNSLGTQESDSGQPESNLVNMQIFYGILPLVHKLLNVPKEMMKRSISWPAGLILLTEEEQREAGIHFGD